MNSHSYYTHIYVLGGGGGAENNVCNFGRHENNQENRNGITNNTSNIYKLNTNSSKIVSFFILDEFQLS